MSAAKRRTIRSLYALHKWTGLISGVNILILSLTAAYILVERIAVGDGDTIRGDAPLIDDERRVPMQPVIDKMQVRLADYDASIFAVSRAVVEGDLNAIGFELPEDKYFRLNVDVYTGALSVADGEPPAAAMENGLADGLVFNESTATEEIANLSPLGEWMLELHGHLFLGTPGLIWVGVVGVAFFVSTLTGMYIYAPFMKAQFFGAIRRRKLRFAIADAHKVIGITSLAFNALIALTGIGITLGFFAIEYYLYNQLRSFEAEFGDFATADPLPSFESLLAAGKEVLPGEHIYHINYPGGIQGNRSLIVFARPNPWKDPLVPTYAAVSAEVDPRPLYAVTPLWVKAILIGAPIHYGEFGGRPIRVVYLLFALTSGALSVSGFVVWFAKGRQRRATRPQSDVAQKEPRDTVLHIERPDLARGENAP